MRICARTLLAGVGLLSACADDLVTAPDDATPLSASAAIGQVVTGFHWLPPMVPQPRSYTGAFDPRRRPTVTLECIAPLRSGCGGQFKYRFGTGAYDVRLDRAGENYSVFWETPTHMATGDTRYRLRVRDEDATLAEAEVLLVRSRAEAKALHGRRLAAVLGTPYLIKFRIERGTTSPATLRVMLNPSQATLAPGESVPLTAAVVTAGGQTVPDAVITWSSSAAGTALVGPTGVVQALAPGTANITAASTGAVSASAAITVGALPLVKSATIGASGGALATPLANGGSLEVVVPPGAVEGPTSFAVEAIARAPGAQASFRFTPARRVFEVPIQFRYTPGPGNGATGLALVWTGTVGRGFAPLLPLGPAATLGGSARLIGALPALTPVVAPLPAVRTARLLAEGDESAEVSVLGITAAELVIEGGLALDRFLADPTLPMAHDLMEIMDFVAIQRFRPDFEPGGAALLDRWRTSVCARFEQAVAAFQAVPVAPPFDLDDWEREVNTLAAWAAPAEQTRASELDLPFDGCPNGFPDYELLLGGKVTAMGPHLEGLVFPAGRDLVLRFNEILDQHLARVLDFKAQLELLGLLQFHGPISRFEAMTMTELRRVAWQRCRDHGDLSRSGRLLEFEALPRESQSDYTLADVAADIIGCTTLLEWRSRSHDAEGQGPGLGSGTVGGTGMGAATSIASVAMPENGELVLKGLVHILQCPTDIRTGSTSVENVEQLVVKAVGRSAEAVVVTRSPPFGGPRTYVHNDSILVTLEAIDAALGGSDDDFLQLEVRRVGNTCVPPLALLPHDVVLGRFNVSIPRPSVAISPTSATLDPGATASFTATTEHTSSAVTWEVTGGTHSVDGNTLTYTAGDTPGNYEVKARLEDHPDREAVATIVIEEAQCPSSGAPSLRRASGAALAACVTVSIVPASATLNFGQTRRFQAYNASGTPAPVTWSASSGTISSTGLYTAHDFGTHTVRATSVADPSVVATAEVSVRPTGSLVISPSVAAVGIGRTRQYTVVSGVGPFAWGVDGQAGTVSQSGLFTAGGIEGEFGIHVSSGNATAVATVFVDSRVGFWRGDWQRLSPALLATDRQLTVVRTFDPLNNCGLNQDACYGTNVIDMGSVTVGPCGWRMASPLQVTFAGGCEVSTSSDGLSLSGTINGDTFSGTLERAIFGTVVERWVFTMTRQ